MKGVRIFVFFSVLFVACPWDASPHQPAVNQPQRFGVSDVGLKTIPGHDASGTRLAMSTKTGRTSVSPREPLELNLRDFIELVYRKNERILFQQLEWGVAKDAVEGERGIFEPDFVGAYQHDKNRYQNTVEEIIARSPLIYRPDLIFDERNNTYSGAVEGLVPTGTRLRLGYDLREINNNLSDFLEPGGLDQYKTFLGASLEQPLLKNGGIKATMAKIRIAEADADVAFQAYRQEMMGTVFDAASTYWELYLAQERYKVRQDSVRIASELLQHNREWASAGRMAETEVMEAEAGLALRKSLESAAGQEMTSAMNRVRSFFSSSTAEEEMPVRATDKLRVEIVDADFNQSYIRALKLRPEYLSTRRKIEREGIRVEFAKNQRWPQLDLKASYGINGLDTSASGSWKYAADFDYEAYTVGVELRIPIVGGTKSRSELRAAKKRKKQSLLELKAVEVALANATDTAVQSLQSAKEQVLYYENAVSLRKRLLDVEMERFRAGKSDSRLLLEREGDLLVAREAELESLVNYKKAALELGRAEGTLLVSHGIEVMEVRN